MQPFGLWHIVNWKTGIKIIIRITGASAPLLVSWSVCNTDKCLWLRQHTWKYKSLERIPSQISRIDCEHLYFLQDRICIIISYRYSIWMQLYESEWMSCFKKDPLCSENGQSVWYLETMIASMKGIWTCQHKPKHCEENIMNYIKMKFCMIL